VRITLVVYRCASQWDSPREWDSHSDVNKDLSRTVNLIAICSLIVSHQCTAVQIHYMGMRMKNTFSVGMGMISVGVVVTNIGLRFKVPICYQICMSYFLPRDAL